MKRKEDTLKSAILSCIKKIGPMTAAQLSAALEWTPKRTQCEISRIRQESPKQYLRISGYEPHPVRGPNVCVYSAEAGEDVAREYVTKENSIKRWAAQDIKSKSETIVSHTRYGPRGSERIIIPVHQRPFRNSTTTGLYLGSELSYRGRA